MSISWTCLRPNKKPGDYSPILILNTVFICLIEVTIFRLLRYPKSRSVRILTLYIIIFNIGLLKSDEQAESQKKNKQGVKTDIKIKHTKVNKGNFKRIEHKHFSSTEYTVPKRSVVSITPGATKKWKYHHSLFFL